MASRLQLTPVELAEAVASAASVVSDHAPALDLLAQGPEWAAAESDTPEGADDGQDRPADPDAAGSALARTLAAAADQMVGATSDMSALVAAMERGARSAARPSQVVEVLAGFTEALRNTDHLDGERFAIGLEIAAERLADGDDGAHPGCLPAVVAAAAAGALGALDAGADLGDTVIAAADEGLVELEAGPVDNPALVESGTVDAVAAGFLLVLDVLASAVTGEPLPEPPGDVRSVSSDGRRYEVRCRIRPHDGCGIESADWLESTWHEMGELIEFDGLGTTWTAGVVTASPGAAIEAIFEVGRPRDLHIAVTADRS